MANSEGNRPSGSVTRRGLLLKETREGKGLTIETVHEMTKIPLDVLHAIEEGYTVRMVSAYYFKGFIKMYAKFLALDPSLVLDEPIAPPALSEDAVPASVVNDKEHRKFNEFLTRQNKKHMAFGMVVGGAALVAAVVGFIIFGRGSSDAKNYSAPPPVKKEAKKKVVPPSVPAKAKTAKAEPKPVKPVVAQKKEAVKAVEEQKPRQKAVSKKVNLTIKSRVTGWLQVKVDGEVVFQSTMHEGTTETWQAEKSIEISGKNINNLEFEVNGKVLGQLGKSERGARRVVITSDGLSVIK